MFLYVSHSGAVPRHPYNLCPRSPWQRSNTQRPATQLLCTRPTIILDCFSVSHYLLLIIVLLTDIRINTAPRYIENSMVHFIEEHSFKNCKLYGCLIFTIYTTVIYYCFQTKNRLCYVIGDNRFVQSRHKESPYHCIALPSIYQFYKFMFILLGNYKIK